MGNIRMRTRTTISIVVSSLLGIFSATAAFANADDDAWIKRCVSDNQDQGQSTETIYAYCACMNEKMPSSETRSVTAWEKTHKAEAEACSTKAGWKGD
jgi:hypothetical protein